MISIIIPTYGRSHRIKDTIHSIFNENYKINYEIIIIDDNGKGTEEQIKTESECLKFDKVKYIVNKENRGANYSRNIGIKNSKYEFVALLDDDDKFINGKLDKIAEYLNNGNYDLIYSGIIYKSKTEERYVYETAKNFKKNILKSNFIGSNSSVVLKKEVVKKVGYFDENLVSCQDWDLWIRIIFSNFKILGIDDKLVLYLENSDLTRITNSFENRKTGHEIILKKTIKNYLRYFNDDEQKEILEVQKNRIAWINYDSNNFKEFRKIIISTQNYKEKIKYLFSILNIRIIKPKLDWKNILRVNDKVIQRNK